eukprot:CAMPEP_0206243636 /NCGR_PEP_ID=MMETSP0047_2-20121206/17710_1 /ASSEMBLY_ACC=CAM_ASM_000192 /TAXON_ID=195065 /ORGANISM="Chroomonas mesostigmatica_cf, Strain CCMP1168" /LENGTH=95 /DNA_ID=CAMNT_0053668763 /DNA_START=250 /DNA_END=533 /DNA_ORIENTATION=-
MNDGRIDEGSAGSASQGGEAATPPVKTIRRLQLPWAPGGGPGTASWGPGASLRPPSLLQLPPRVDATPGRLPGHPTPLRRLPPLLLLRFETQGLL